MATTFARRTVARTYPQPAPAPAVFRLRNPWTFHLVASCVVAALTVTGGFAAVAVFDQARLGWIAGAVGVSLVLVLVLSTAHARFEANPPQSAFVPVDPS